MLAPIALFCYRRLDILEQTLEALKNNELAHESDLIIFSDGYKNKAQDTLIGFSLINFNKI